MRKSYHIVVNSTSNSLQNLVYNPLGDGHEVVRQAAAQALGHLGEGALAQAVLDALVGKPQKIITLNDARAVEPLIHALRNDGEVRQAAVQTLVQIGTPAIEPLVLALRAGGGDRQAATQALVQIGTPAVEPLICALRSDGEVPQAAVQALVRIGALAVGPLIHTLGDGNEVVRQAAALALGQLGESALALAVLDALASKPQRIVALNDARAVEPLMHALEDRAMRQAAIQASVQIGAHAVGPLVRVLGHSNWHVRQMAVLVGHPGMA